MYSQVPIAEAAPGIMDVLQRWYSVGPRRIKGTSGRAVIRRQEQQSVALVLMKRKLNGNLHSLCGNKGCGEVVAIDMSKSTPGSPSSEWSSRASSITETNPVSEVGRCAS